MRVRWPFMFYHPHGHKLILLPRYNNNTNRINQLGVLTVFNLPGFDQRSLFGELLCLVKHVRLRRYWSSSYMHVSGIRYCAVCILSSRRLTSPALAPLTTHVTCQIMAILHHQWTVVQLSVMEVLSHNLRNFPYVLWFWFICWKLVSVIVSSAFLYAGVTQELSSFPLRLRYIRLSPVTPSSLLETYVPAAILIVTKAINLVDFALDKGDFLSWNKNCNKQSYMSWSYLLNTNATSSILM